MVNASFVSRGNDGDGDARVEGAVLGVEADLRPFFVCAVVRTDVVELLRGTS